MPTVEIGDFWSPTLKKLVFLIAQQTGGASCKVFQKWEIGNFANSPNRITLLPLGSNCNRPVHLTLKFMHNFDNPYYKTTSHSIVPQF
jgi:hypothetical protein